MTPRAAAARLARRLRRTRALRAARRELRSLGKGSRPSAIVCWDLDNTLVGSGALLRKGLSLDEAVVAAEPVANMLEFFAELGEAIPGAAHVVLSARDGSLRRATADWLQRYGLAVQGERLWLVPDADSKLGLWRRLARLGPLVVVDDLTHGHEGEAPLPYAALAAEARSLAAAYIGADAIAEIVGDREAARRIAAETASTFARTS